MKIEFEGRVYDFDLDDLDVKQAVAIEKHIGGTLLEWEEGLEKVSVPCYQALGWMILHRGDVSVPIGDVNFKVMKLAKAWNAAADAEAAQEEPDPTTPAGLSTQGSPASTPSPTGLPGSSLPPASGTAPGLTG